ncbi:prepilin-type N-terminal cleavage/methylation domain-containing protein [Paludisphaera rhizosphaerae]|uniref:prepilin-type N-terminal cleavage/methylation domain-containing protein n=1 Tax=Paludisphaera rhizosphaerae TaxID=2711216 RepID=UPI0028F4115D|nr:prepilin-type N-terminal cleavage/methylation domain-containing protein [Paludisphaera rhizosphaerae]
MAVSQMIRCDRCGRAQVFEVDPSPLLGPAIAGYAEAKRAGWTWFNGVSEFLCPPCSTAPEPRRTRMRQAQGFTLIELLVVLVIVAIVAAVALPVVQTAWSGRKVDSAAQVLQGELAAARARAQASPGGVAGIRLLPDPSFPIARLADGSVDPSGVLAYDRVVPLVAPPGYQDGRVSIRSNYPAAFAAILPANRLVLEQQVGTDYRNPDGSTTRIPVQPTSWAWNVRVGDQLELLGRRFNVVGPVAVGPAQGNVELFVNYDPAWLAAANRGDGPAEFLLLSNNLDDDADGYPDNGADGLDNDVDGLVDEADEWTETEVWGPLPTSSFELPYLIRRRPAPGPGTSGVALAGAVIDATGYAATIPARSVLPVDPWTGAVDLVVDWTGSWSRARTVGVPTADGLKSSFWHLWIADRGDVSAPASAEGTGRLVTIAARSGRVVAGEADAANPVAARATNEGRGR